MGRLHRRYKKSKHKKNPSSGPRANPPLLRELAEFAGPGFAAFAATRFGTRVIAMQVAKRKPTWGKHAGALASVGAFLAAWLLAHRIKWLAKYQTPIAVGAAIAAAQSLVQLYIPRLGWIVADATPEIASAGAQQMRAGAAMGALPADMEYVDEDPELYVYDDRYDAGTHTTKTQEAAQAKQYRAPSSAASADDLIDLEMEGDESQPAGIFGAG